MGEETCEIVAIVYMLCSNEQKLLALQSKKKNRRYICFDVVFKQYKNTLQELCASVKKELT